MKKHKTLIIDLVLIFALLFFVVTPIVQWYDNPEWTLVQILQKFWLYYMLAIIAIVVFTNNKY